MGSSSKKKKKKKKKKKNNNNNNNNSSMTCTFWACRALQFLDATNNTQLHYSIWSNSSFSY